MVAAAVMASTRFIPTKMYVINSHVRATWALAGSQAATLFDGSWLESGSVVVLVLVGAVWLARDRNRRWLVVSLALFIAIFLLLYAVNGPVVRQLTWLWWNDHYRVRAALVLPAVLCATAGAVVIGGWVARRRPDPPRVRQGLIALAAVAVVAALGCGIPVHREVVEATYEEASADYSWVLPREYAALSQLAAFVPSGSVVAANPYRGGMFFYVAGGTEVLYPTENSSNCPIGDCLERRSKQSQACPTSVPHHVVKGSTTCRRVETCTSGGAGPHPGILRGRLGGVRPRLQSRC